VLIDPIDGTRGIMYDKRAAWALAGVAPNRGPATRLSDIHLAVMTELPTSKMGFADVWNKTLVYFGIAEEDDWDEDGYLTDEELQRSYAERPNVRRLAPRRREREFELGGLPHLLYETTAGEM